MQAALEFIAHRRNTPADMRAVPAGQGAEFDVRSCFDAAGRLTLHAAHDPCPQGPAVQDVLAAYAGRPNAGVLIANTKEDGLEGDVAALMARLGIDSYFFLDTQMPTLRQACSAGAGAHFAVRLSDSESVDYFAAQPPRLRPKWVWVDCFAGQPLATAQVAPLRGLFDICLVSPELHLKRDAAQMHEGLRRIPQFMELASLSQAICTKRPDLWKRHIQTSMADVPQLWAGASASPTT